LQSRRPKSRRLFITSASELLAAASVVERLRLVDLALDLIDFAAAAAMPGSISHGADRYAAQSDGVTQHPALLLVIRVAGGLPHLVFERPQGAAEIRARTTAAATAAANLAALTPHVGVSSNAFVDAVEVRHAAIASPKLALACIATREVTQLPARDLTARAVLCLRFGCGEDRGRQCCDRKNRECSKDPPAPIVE
jgi:hypothetical protein